LVLSKIVSFDKEQIVLHERNASHDFDVTKLTSVDVQIWISNVCLKRKPFTYFLNKFFRILENSLFISANTNERLRYIDLVSCTSNLIQTFCLNRPLIDKELINVFKPVSLSMGVR
jgi:hypothetical protein